MTGYPRPRRVTVFKLAAILLGTVAALVAAEAFLRAFHRPRLSSLPRPAESADTGPAGASAYMATPWYFPFEASPTDLLATTIPFSSQPDARALHNSNGFRTPEYTISRRPGTFRIVVVGDSFSWGQGVAMEETWASRLETLLGDGRLPNGLTPEVINLGVCGHRHADNLIKLLVHGADLKPDLVLWQIFWNDIALVDPWSVGQAWAEAAPTLAGRLGRSLTATRIADESSRIDAALEAFENAYRPGSAEWRVAEETFRQMESFRRAAGVPLAAVVFPNLMHGPVSAETRALGIKADKPYRQLVASLQSLRLPVIDLSGTLQREGQNTVLVVSEADLHPNAFAHELAARDTVAFLGRAGLLRGRSRSPDPGYADELALRHEAASRRNELAADPKGRTAFHERVLALHPGDAWTAFLLADSYARCDRHEDATRVLNSLLALRPRYAAPWHALSSETMDQGRKRALLEKMIEVLPDHTPSLEDLAGMDFADGRAEDGCRRLARVAEIPRYTDQLRRVLSQLAAHGCRMPAGPNLVPFSRSPSLGAPVARPSTGDRSATSEQ